MDGIVPGLRDINVEIALSLDVQTLGNLCSVNRWYFDNICRNDDFWKEKFRRDFILKLFPTASSAQQQLIFKEIAKSKPETWKNYLGFVMYGRTEIQPFTWRDSYEEAKDGFLRFKPIYFDDRMIGYVWIRASLEYSSTNFSNNIVNLVKETYPDINLDNLAIKYSNSPCSRWRRLTFSNRSAGSSIIWDTPRIDVRLIS